MLGVELFELATMPRICRSFLVLMACCPALAACGTDAVVSDKPESDPALIGALADPLMSDPDLSSQDRAAAAIAMGGPPVAEMPLVERTPQAIEAAREEARQLVGGTLKSAPSPENADAPAVDGVTASQVAAFVPGLGPACAGKAEYGMSWSLSLPAPLAIYPRGHLREAAGTDRDGCRMRVVRFVTPVEADDVVDFYFTRLSGAGLGVKHRLSGAVHVLQGGKGNLAYIIRARTVLLRNTGAAVTPMNSWLFLQGLETLHLRLERHSENALKVAQHLEGHPAVAWVNYPGLDSSPSKEIADRVFTGKGYGGLVSFGIKTGREGGKKFVEALELFSHLANIGDAKSLAIHNATTTHSQLTPEELEAAGVPEDMIRLSVGIENADDIIADIDQALAKAGA